MLRGDPALRYLEHARAIVAANEIVIASPDLDCQCATDITVALTNNGRVALRIRRNEALRLGGTEFTLRANASGGGRSEADKILEPKNGDEPAERMLYGFEPPGNNGTMLARWAYINLVSLRAHWQRGYLQGKAGATGVVMYREANGSPRLFRWFNIIMLYGGPRVIVSSSFDDELAKFRCFPEPSEATLRNSAPTPPQRCACGRLHDRPGRTCAGCHKYRGYNGYHLDSKSADGHQPWCKNCKHLWASPGAAPLDMRVYEIVNPQSSMPF